MAGKSYFDKRVSRLDLVDEQSWINNNEIRGFCAMFHVVTVAYILSTCWLRLQQDHYILDVAFFRKTTADAGWMLVVWPLCSLYCWTAWLLQQLVLSGLHNVIRVFLQHLTQSFMFLVAAYLILSNDWGFSQTTFVTMLVLTHFMKMHSYTVSNRNMREEWLRQPGCNPYPSNLTASNFFWFMVAPALIYQPQYPYRPFRHWYFWSKILQVTLYLMMVYVLTSELIYPIVQQAANCSYLECLVRLIVPCICLVLFLFLVIFDLILNLFAEMAGFADRDFYGDWWNASSWEEFNRKWNRPVHLFLYQYVYLECFSRYHWSAATSRFVTFLFSALCHEMVISLVCRVVRPYMLGLMMFQLPLMIICKPLSQSKAGLYMCWFGIAVGPPLIITLYAKASHSVL